jgi:UDP-N-acetyl-D-mannosaminuronate dehydrogenase
VASLRIAEKVFKTKPYSEALLKSADAVVITTNHATFNPREILSASRLVIDTRNLMHGLTAKHLVRL